MLSFLFEVVWVDDGNILVGFVGDADVVLRIDDHVVRGVEVVTLAVTTCVSFTKRERKVKARHYVGVKRSNRIGEGQCVDCNRWR